MAHIVWMLQNLGWKYLPWLVPLVIANLLYKRYATSLRHVPGPFLASFSNLWKLTAAWDEDMPEKNIAVHRKYGPVVRIGHNTVSVSDPSALSTIYSFQAWNKVRIEVAAIHLNAAYHYATL